MKSKFKWLAMVSCIILFAAMALRSGSSSDKTKEVTEASGKGKSSGEKQTTDSKNEETTGKDVNKAVEESINEQVLVEQDGIKISATEYITDSIWGDGIKLLIENSSGSDYTVGCDALIVNDYMISDLFASEIAAGKK